jgi:hypothetical protein
MKVPRYIYKLKARKTGCITKTRILSEITYKPAIGSAIAQAVSRWLPTTAARVQTRV